MSAISVNSITGRTGTHGPVLTGVTTTAVTHANRAVTEALKLTTNGSYLQINSQEAGPALSFGQYDNTYPTWTTAQVAGIRDGSSWNGSLTFWTNSGSSATDISEKVRITSTGNVGIGTDTFTAPSSGRKILEIGGASGSLINFDVGGTRKAYHFTDGTDVYSYNTTATGSYSIGTNNTERVVVSYAGSFAVGRPAQITMNDGNKSDSVFEQLTNNYYPLALHSSKTNKRGLAIFYSDTGAGVNGDSYILCQNLTSTKFQVKSNGEIVTTGNLVVANGQGIDFSATGDGSGTATSELLDDYEEGTFTPNIGTISGSSFTNYTTQPVAYGNYVKVGELVYVTIYFTGVASGAASATDSVGVGNLPFTTASNNSSGYSPVSCWPYTFWDGTNVANGAQLISRTQVGTNFLFLQKITVSGGAAGVVSTDMLSSINLMLSTCYIAI